MVNTKWNLFCYLVVTVASSAACPHSSSVIETHYEEKASYSRNPQCKPSKLDKGIKCSNIGPTIEVKGGLYSSNGLHYVPLASVYYAARFADALGYQSRCPTNTTFLKQLDLIAPWSGLGAFAVDGSCGYHRLVRRQCVFPTKKYPFLCKGIEGTPGTYGERLETLSYVSILQGANLRWTLFVNCWRAQTPDDPQSEEIATSFNVFSLDPVLCEADRELVIRELKTRGFNTHPSNLIGFDYSTTACS